MILLASPLFGPWDYLGMMVAAGVMVVALVTVAVSGRGPRHETSRRLRRPGAAAGGTPVSRRTVVERGALGLFGAALAGVVSASVDYVVRAGGRRGATLTLPGPEEVRRQMAASGRPYYEADGGFYLVAYPVAGLPEARDRYEAPVLRGMEAGFVALDQTCTHLGCRVLWCPTSQWFECPCHGSLYNAVGEQRRGPAPRGLDRYGVRMVDGRLSVDTGTKYLGPPPGTDTTYQKPAGPHCV